MVFDLNTYELVFKLELYEDVDKYYQELNPSFYRVRMPLCQSYFGFSFAHEQDAEQFKKLVSRHCRKSDVMDSNQLDQQYEQDKQEFFEEELDRINSGDLTLQEKQIIKHAGIKKKEFNDERLNIKSIVCELFFQSRKSNRQSFNAFQRGIAQFRKNRQTMLNQQRFYEAQQKMSQQPSQNRQTQMYKSEMVQRNSGIQVLPNNEALANPSRAQELGLTTGPTLSGNLPTNQANINLNDPQASQKRSSLAQGLGGPQLPELQQGNLLQSQLITGQRGSQVGVQPPVNLDPLQNYYQQMEQQQQLEEEEQKNMASRLEEDNPENEKLKKKLISIRCSQNLNDLSKARKTIQIYKEQIKLLPNDGFQSIVKQDTAEMLEPATTTLQPPPFELIFQNANQQDNPISQIFQEQ